MSETSGQTHVSNIVDLLSSEALSPEYVVETTKEGPRCPQSPTPQRSKRPKFVNLISSDGPTGSPEPRRKRFVEAEGNTKKPKDSSVFPRARSKSSAKVQISKRETTRLAKATWDRKYSVKELLCTLHGDLRILEPALTEAGVRMSHQPGPGLDGVVGYISLRRETKTVWNHAIQAYVEGELHFEREKQVIVVLDAECCPVFKGCPVEFFDQMENFLGDSIIYIVEGFDKIFQAQLRKYNKVLQRRTRAAINDGNIGASEPLPPYPSQDDHMRLKISIQRTNKRIIYTKDRKTTSRWIVDLLKDISLKRYLNDDILKLSTTSGKSKTEVNEIVIEALAQIPGVSRRQAATIGNSYGCVGRVFREYRDGVDIQRLIQCMDPDECL